MSDKKMPIRVSISQAAKLFGVSEKTIREAIKNNEVRYVVVKGRYKIDFESLIIWSQKTPLRQAKRDQDGIGRYVDKWKINNQLYFPSKKFVEE